MAKKPFLCAALHLTRWVAFGALLGAPLAASAFGFGLAQVFTLYPELHKMLRFVGAAYLLYLAWRILRAGDPAGNAEVRAKPLTLLEAAAFQWVNPKAWLLALAAIPAFTRPGGDLVTETLVIAGVFLVVSPPSVGFWAMVGAGAGRILGSPRQLRIFNVTMALLLLLSLVPAFV